MDSKPVKLAIVGGGAAGLFAAAVAAQRGVPCILIERKARVGSKVLMTANGRCNFTKDISAEQFLADLACAGSDAVPRFVRAAVTECPPRQIAAIFKSLGMPVRRMADGRLFPADGKAATVLHAFGDLLRDNEIPLLTNCAVRRLRRASGGFLLDCGAFEIAAENVLLATGGVSYPKTGSVGDGQNFARELGHTIVPYRPGLIGLETNDPRVTSLAGRRFEDDGRVKVIDASGRTLFDYHGEVDCERFGLSGAAIYNAQRFLEYRKRARGSADDLTLEVWFGHNRLTFSRLTPRPVKEAIVTLGGVSLEEIDPATMQSRLVPGLSFAGEVMDIDGPTGGYNLTLAFATARKAVTAIQPTAAARRFASAGNCGSRAPHVTKAPHASRYPRHRA